MEGKNQDYCMGRVDQETSEDSEKIFKSREWAKITEASDGLTLLTSEFTF